LVPALRASTNHRTIRAARELKEGGRMQHQTAEPASLPPATNAWVPHISLVFREMWDTTALNPKTFCSQSTLKV
jgi:hypothetical protein